MWLLFYTHKINFFVNHEFGFTVNSLFLSFWVSCQVSGSPYQNFYVWEHQRSSPDPVKINLFNNELLRNDFIRRRMSVL